MLVFFWLGGRGLPLSHAVPADTSLALLCLILVLGAGARLAPRLRRYVPWRRELGIGMAVTAVLHVAILANLVRVPTDLIDLVPTGLFGEDCCPLSTKLNDFDFFTSMWAAANWVGLAALGYALVLAATANDWSLRRLGRGWKFVHQQTYTLFVLTWLHTAAFVLLGAVENLPARLSPWLFWVLTVVVVVAQSAGFVRTVRSSGRTPAQRGRAMSVGPASRVSSSRAVRWFAVVTLWSAFTAATLLLTLEAG